MEYKLIMAVSGFPSLYDTNSPNYRDLNARGDAWRQVSEMVGVPESECRRKWKMLRDQHRRERQREKDRRQSAAGLFNYRPWRYSAILSFLNPFIDARAAGTNGWALDPPPPLLLQASDMTGCSTTTEPRSDDDDCYGFAVATTTSSSSSWSESAQRKRPASAGRDGVRVKAARTEATAETGVTGGGGDVGGQTPLHHVNVRELFEVMMQSVTALAASLASSHSSLQSQDQLTPPAAAPPCTTSGLSRLKTEEQEEQEEEAAAELSDHTDSEECRAASPRATGGWRRSTDSLLEEFLRRSEAREAQREQREQREQRDDVTLFLLSLAPAIRRLPAQRQSWIRTRIQQLVHEAEFGSD